VTGGDAGDGNTVSFSIASAMALLCKKLSIPRHCFAMEKIQTTTNWQ